MREADVKKAIDNYMQGHECLQSLLISIPTFVGTKDFSVIHVPAKCFYGLIMKNITGKGNYAKG